MNKVEQESLTELRERMRVLRAPASKKETRVFHEFLKHPPGKELYGYDIWSKYPFELSRNSIYTLLGNLETKGLLESRLEVLKFGDAHAPRRYYKLSSFGESFLLN